MKKTIKILLLIGVSIFTFRCGEVALRYLSEDYGNKVKVETWNRRITEVEHKERVNKKDTVYQNELFLTEVLKAENRSKKSQDDEQDKSSNCIFQEDGYFIPQIRQSIGDTINIQKTYDWIKGLEMTRGDDYIKKLINREGKFFQVNERENFITIGLLEDEGEYIGVNIYIIDKKTCGILGMALLAETTAWENGYKETYSVFEDNYSIRRERRTGARDWGDYTKWARDTIITTMIFDDAGKIIFKKR